MRDSQRLQRFRGGAATALLVCAIAAMLLPSAPVEGSTASVTVTAEVVSLTTLDNSCTQPVAHRFDTVLPGATDLTATGAEVCRLSFASNNATASLRIRQSDGVGTAMGSTPTATTARSGTGMGAVAAVDATRAYGVEYAASTNNFHATTDGGDTWTTTSTGLNGGNHTSMATIGASTVLLTRQFGAVTRSTDGGAMWANVATPTSATSTTLYDIAASSAAAVYAVGGGGKMIKSTDGGATWVSVATPVTETLAAVAAPTDSIVYAVTDTKLLRSTNGGSSWTTTTITTGNINAMAAPDASTIWVAGANGLVLRSTDGGDSFTSVPAGTTLYYTLDAVDAFQAYVGGAGTPMRTTNGGTSWSNMATNNSSIIRDLAAPNSSRVFAAFDAQTIGLSNDGGVTWSYPLTKGSEVSGMWTDGVRTVTVGGIGRIERSIDRGSTWASVPSGTAARLFGVELYGSRGWAVGTGGEIVSTTDGGATWAAQPSPTSVDLQAVAAADQATGIAIGKGGTIATTTNGGASWGLRTSGTTQNLNGVSATTAGTGLAVAVGNAGVILTSTDDGATWTSRTSGTTVSLQAVDVVDGTMAWVAGYDGTVLRTTDAGASWASVGTGVASNDFTEVSAPTRDVAWASMAVWSTDQWRRTADAGATWQAGGASGVAPRAMSAADAETVFLAGINNVIAVMRPSRPIPDYGAGSPTWSGTGMFGGCLQAVGGGATAATWTVDDGGTPGRCEASDTDRWYGIPTSPATIATAPASTNGSVDLVWGIKVPATQQKGQYTAGITAEVVSPAA